MKFKGYFLTALTISIVVSLLNGMAWYIDEKANQKTYEGWNYDFGFYMFSFLISVTLSLVMSLFVLFVIWAIEKFRNKFTPIAHFVFPVGVVLFNIITKAPVGVYFFSLLFLIPGVAGYYFFVFRKLPDLEVNSDLLDHE